MSSEINNSSKRVSNSHGILYSAICKEKEILIDYSETKGNIDVIVHQILSKLDSDSSRDISYVYDDHYTFHCSIENGDDKYGEIVLIVVTCDLGNRFPLKFVRNVIREWKKFLDSGMVDYITFQPILEKYTKSFSTEDQLTKTSSGDSSNGNIRKENEKLDKIKDQLEETKSIMVDNIEKVIDRGQKLNILIDMTDDLLVHADDFRNQASTVRWNFFRNRIYLMGCLCITLCVLSLIIFWLFCMAIGRC